MYFSTPVSFILTLFAAAMWGSWTQITKHLKGYPITGLIFWLYSISFVYIWIITLLLAPALLPEGIIAAASRYADVLPKIIFGGATMSLGILCTLLVINRVGMVLSATINGGLGVILGVVISVVEEGVTERKLLLVILIALIYITAGLLSAYASSLRNRDHGIKGNTNSISVTVLVTMIAAAVLHSGWSMAVAAGTANGIPPVLTCAFVCTGAFLSVLTVSLIIFTYKKMWKKVLCIGRSKKPVLMGLVSACCHFGGNLISIYSMPALTATISFLLGRTANLWTLVWGIYYKEFSNISKKTKFILASSIILFLLGTVLVALTK